MELDPAELCLALPELFARLLPLWLFGAPGLIAYLSTLRLKKAWAALLEKARSDGASAEEPQASDDPEL